MPGMEQRISLVTLGVADLRRAMDFYSALGWHGRSPDNEIAFYQAGGIIFALWDRAKLAADTAVADPGGWGGITLAHNVRAREEVDAVLAEASAAGARIVRPAGDTEWGGYSGVFADPEGHAWEVAWGAGWTIHEDGSITLD